MRTSQLTAAATSPAHSLHHVCDKAVRDAWTGFLSQIEGVFQLLNGAYAAAARPPLLLQLQELKHIVWFVVQQIQPRNMAAQGVIQPLQMEFNRTRSDQQRKDMKNLSKSIPHYSLLFCLFLHIYKLIEKLHFLDEYST